MKKIRMLSLLFVVTTLGGCGWADRYFTANITGYSRECVEGVSYLQFPSGVTVQYTTDGKIKTCK